MNKLDVVDLLTNYKGWVNKDEIEFLRNRSHQKAMSLAIEELKEAYKNRNGNEDWLQKVHEKGRELWRKLASYALNNIDSNSKGNSRLFEFLEAATNFEELLYGLEDYYRDHTLHSLWVYLIGEHLLRGDLKNIYNNLNWYLYNDIERFKKKYKYPDELVKEAKKESKSFLKNVDKHKDAVWCIIALCHDLGYSLEKLPRLNTKVQGVLEFFDVPDFRHVGYSLEIEHQYLVSQFLELMAMDVRVVPSEDYRGKKKREKIENVEEKVLIKCYRDDSTYWRLCRALEKKEHGILSAYLIYKILGIFADTSVRGPAEEWGLDDDEVSDNIIRGNILFAIAQHQFDYAHLNLLSSLADVLILADELEEFSRFGRQLRTREYYPTTAEAGIQFNNEKVKPVKPNLNKKTHIEMTYESKHKTREDFLRFFKRKAERLCQLYSLEQTVDIGLKKYCLIESIKIIAKWTDPVTKSDEDYYFHLDTELSKTKGKLPARAKQEKDYPSKVYFLRCYDDELRVILKDSEVSLKDWLGLGEKGANA